MGRRKTPYLERIFFRSDIRIDYDIWPFTIPAVRAIDEIRFGPGVTFFVGENGSGKSTVLEAIASAMGFSPEGGTLNVRLKTVDSVSSLHEAIKLSRNARTTPWDQYYLRAESFFNLATYMDETGYLMTYGGRSLHQQSHGEAFMAVLTHKLAGHGFYLLDEPEAALSPTRQLAALRAIHHLVEDHSQLIIATHSPILLAYPGAHIILFDSNGVQEIRYEDTEHYAITRDFLNHHPQRLARLLAEDEEDEEG